MVVWHCATRWVGVGGISLGVYISEVEIVRNIDALEWPQRLMTKLCHTRTTKGMSQVRQFGSRDVTYAGGFIV